MATSLGEPHQMQTHINCDTCENTAKYFCKSCSDRLCDRCKNIHSKSKGTFDHEVILLTLESLKSSSECPSHVACKRHPKFRASIGCQKCEVPVCDQCLIGEHNSHNFISIAELFLLKKEKLEQKLSTVRSELPKYVYELEIVKRRQIEVSKSKDIVKKEIDDYFNSAISSLDASRYQLLKRVDKKISEDIDLLKDEEKILQSCVQNMQEYMVNFQNENLQEKIVFIFYTACEIDNKMPQPNSSSIPGLIKYCVGRFDKALVKAVSGCLFDSAENSKLLEKAAVQIIRSIGVGKGAVLSLVFCLEDKAFWVFKSDRNGFERYDEKGNRTGTLNVNINKLRNEPICIVDSDCVLFRKDSGTVYMLTNSQTKLFIDISPMAVACICKTQNGELLIGLVKHPKYFAVGRFSLTGECKHYITPMFDDWTPETLFNKDVHINLYTDENLNGDICLSMGVVHVLRANGWHRFTYEGKEARISHPFLSRGICTDVLGHILVADENNRGIHVLDKDGRFLTMLTIPGEPQVIPISLCKDHINNLCIGCADGKIRILKYLD